jgi:hypothetical protein
MTLTLRPIAIAGILVLFTAARPAHLSAADLTPATVAAFERYVQSTEARIDAEVRTADRFLWPQTLSPSERDSRMAALHNGTLLIEKLETRPQGRSIDIPGGLVHHWVGVAFMPGVPIDRAIAMLQDYDRHATIYAPRVARSTLRSHDDNTFQFHLRFFMKKVITVVVDSENTGKFTRPSHDRAFSRIVSTRMAEVENPGTSSEREKPVGHDGGYLWRLNSYWRFLEMDGGTYLQCESVSLTRGIPTGLGWLVGPFVTSLPRESLEFTLDTTRRALASR